MLARIISLAWLAAGAFAFYRDEIWQPADTSKWRIVRLVPPISFAWWLVITLVIFAGWLFEAAFRRQRPGFHLSLDEQPWVPMIKPGKGQPLRVVAQIALRNGTDHSLAGCGVQVRVVSPNLPSGSAAVWACEPFGMLVDDYANVPFIEYELGTDNKNLTIRNHPVVTAPKMLPATPVLKPGAYNLMIEAVASNARLARFPIRLQFRDGDWYINGRPHGGVLNRQTQAAPRQAS